jgi:hypothetical protein
MYSVTEDGEPFYDTDQTEGDFKCYYCTKCERTFDGERDDFGRIYTDQDDAWKLAKEHCSG